ncbi:MAG: endonuclease/exonuclease/phosphatase family protein [Paracoccaceae bacterium]
MRSILLGLTCIAGLLAIIGFLGHLHRSFDTVSMGRPVFGLLCIIGIIVAKPIWFKLVFSTVAVAALLSVAHPFLPQDPGNDLRVYSKNLWFANSEIPALVSDIEASRADAVMLQEVSDQNRVILDLLKQSFPHQQFCRFSNWSGIALLSRHPFESAPHCSNWRALAVAPVRVENERVWLVSAHIPWPWPHDSSSNETEVERMLAELDGPVVIAGDFNIMPWSGRVGRIASITNTQLAGPVRPTLKLRHLPLPLDFVLAPEGGSTELRPLLGSDHAGILAKLTLWPPKGSQ